MKGKLFSIIITAIIIIPGIFVLIYFTDLYAKGTNVGGLIDTDTVWNVMGSPYIVVSDIEVANGVNLTIEPGVHVKFDGKYRFYVYGYLKAMGTEVSRINITSNKISPNPSDWISINVIGNGKADVHYCNISYGHNGILLQESSHNNITSNHISNNMYGIILFESTNNTISNNTFKNDGIFLNGDELSHFNSHIIENNTVNGKQLCYHKGLKNVDINSSQVGQLILVNCSQVNIEKLQINDTAIGIEVAFCANVSIVDCIMLNDMDGIAVFHSSDIIVHNNNVSDNWCGIDIRNSINNVITYNNFTLNWVCGVYILHSEKNTVSYNYVADNLDLGFWLDQSWNNYICHNRIINNLNQAVDDRDNNYWDNGYPSGGNYWSDYGGVDNFRGPDQDIPGSDGIGDKPYVIDSDSQDNYPLMNPYKSLENYTILKQGWNLVSIPLIQEEQNLTRVLGSIDGWYDAVQWYDITDTVDPWRHNKIDKPYGNDLFELNETMGFWIHITQPGDTIFLYNGTQPTQNQTIQLYKGWNMVGYPSLTRYNRTTGLNTLDYGTHVNLIQWYDAATGLWHKMGEEDCFVKGRGYWFHAKGDYMWEVPL